MNCRCLLIPAHLLPSAGFNRRDASPSFFTPALPVDRDLGVPRSANLDPAHPQAGSRSSVRERKPVEIAPRRRCGGSPDEVRAADRLVVPGQVDDSVHHSHRVAHRRRDERLNGSSIAWSRAGGTRLAQH